MSSILRLLGFVIISITFASQASAQETINQGTIAGRVFDPQTAAVPGALVIVRHMDTGVTIEATTEVDGRFRFPYLRIGPYSSPCGSWGSETAHACCR